MVHLRGGGAKYPPLPPPKKILALVITSFTWALYHYNKCTRIHVPFPTQKRQSEHRKLTLVKKTLKLYTHTQGLLVFRLP